MAIQFIDLCSGIGGFHSGLMATGHFMCVGHAEIDKNAAKAYKANRLPLILVKFVQTTDAFFYVYVFVFLM